MNLNKTLAISFGFLYLILISPAVFAQSVLNLGAKKGIYSGTFDPPTKAHNAIIRSAIKNLGLEKLYIFVNKNGQKEYKCSSAERVMMLKLMLADLQDKVVIIAQSSDHKFLDYLMIKNIVNERIINITGEDSYKRRLLMLPENRTDFDYTVIIPRKIGYKDDKIELEDNAYYLPIDDTFNFISTSSTEVRQKLAKKSYENIELTPCVLNYIIENNLYNADDESKKELFYEEYFCYVGKRYAPCPPPEFDPLSSKDSWQEKFYKWVNITNNPRKIPC